MSKRTIEVILDTNTVLHFKRVDLMDWKGLVDHDKIVILVTPVLARELEKQKVHNRSAKLRERADAAIRWLVPLSESDDAAELSPSLSLKFIRHSPSVDYAAHRLSHSISDDEFIANAIERRADDSADVAILTDDAGLRIKAPAHGIRTIAPKRSDRLPEEQDDAQKELMRLRKEVATLQARLPKLVLTFRDGRDQVDFTIPKPSKGTPYVPENIELGETRKEAEERIRRRREYELKSQQWRNLVDMHLPVRLTLENKGTGPATDVMLELLIPAFLTPYSHEHFPEHNFSDDPFTPVVKHKDGDRVIEKKADFTILVHPDFREVTFRMDRLVQHRKLHLWYFYLQFDDLKLVQNFTIVSRMTCAELSEPLETKLHVLSRFEGYTYDDPTRTR
jgi:rRNA-processing protein FCF1